ncbi:unnamed protein product [Gordionus sp. m RMFG-2023]
MNKRILSIQSHVVSGYVGNKSATFPLQLLGFEVDPINSVQFSNHTGYRNGWNGDMLNSKSLNNLFDGLISNNLIEYSHLLTGYIGDADFLKSIINIHKYLKEKNPNLIYLCDPVLGDNNKLYVPEGLIPIYKNEILPLANILTPNQYEAEVLSEMKINNENDVIIILKMLHQKGIKTIVLSSCQFDNSENLYCYASLYEKNQYTTVKVEFPKINAKFVGTGDLFCALFLAWYDTYKNDLKQVCDKVLSTMQLILKRTIDYAGKYSDSDQDSAKYLELKLIESKRDIENPLNIINSYYIS